MMSSRVSVYIYLVSLSGAVSRTHQIDSDTLHPRVALLCMYNSGHMGLAAFLAMARGPGACSLCIVSSSQGALSPVGALHHPAQGESSSRPPSAVLKSTSTNTEGKPGILARLTAAATPKKQGYIGIPVAHKSNTKRGGICPKAGVKWTSRPGPNSNRLRALRLNSIRQAPAAVGPGASPSASAPRHHTPPQTQCHKVLGFQVSCAHRHRPTAHPAGNKDARYKEVNKEGRRCERRG